MPLINVLDENTINKIAAGEVVEKPMAVVKELVENSIDAGSKAVTVEIKNGGLDFIRITDNGKGILKGELPLAFCRHATSKITEIDDLSHLTSLGFRGEALASIAAVAMVECITKTSDEMTGIRYEINGGREITCKEIGCPEGTTFVVRSLFFNTPARRKFLKTPSTEGSYIADLMEKFALSHPDISFKFINNGQTKLQTNGTGNLKNVIFQVYGRDITSNIIEADYDSEKVSFSGYIGKPMISRGNRAMMSCFVNGRYIKSSILFRAIEEAYNGYHMSHKYPFAVININIDSTKMDVNVHPSKMEVRFSEADALYSLICNNLKCILKNIELIPVAAPGKDITTTTTTKQQTDPAKYFADRKRGPEPFETIRKENMSNSLMPKDSSVFEHNTKDYTSVKQDSLFDMKQMKSERLKDYIVVGCVFSTYWIIQYGDEMYIMDQHAAHEKVMFEKFSKSIKIGSIASQAISPPIVLTLSAIESELVKNHSTELSEMGFTIEPFGGNEYTVNSVPADLPGIASEDVLLDWIAALANKESADTLTGSAFRDKIASMSCKAAVKGGRHITETEADNLVKQLFELENPFNCPHGRPTMIKMTKRELEKKFGRIL